VVVAFFICYSLVPFGADSSPHYAPPLSVLTLVSSHFPLGPFGYSIAHRFRTIWERSGVLARQLMNVTLTDGGGPESSLDHSTARGQPYLFPLVSLQNILSIPLSLSVGDHL
jgi:hypothetical protein